MAETRLIPNLHGPKLPLQTRPRLPISEDQVVLVFWAIWSPQLDAIRAQLHETLRDGE